MMATFYRAAIFAIEADNESAADQTWIDNGPECGDRVTLADYWPVVEYVALKPKIGGRKLPNNWLHEAEAAANSAYNVIYADAIAEGLEESEARELAEDAADDAYTEASGYEYEE